MFQLYTLLYLLPFLDQAVLVYRHYDWRL